MIDVARPTSGEQRQAWAAAIGEMRGRGIARLVASQFDLNLADIGAVAREAGEETGGGTLTERLWRGAVARARPALATLAQRIDVNPAAGTSSCRKRKWPAFADRFPVRGRATVYDDWGFATIEPRPRDHALFTATAAPARQWPPNPSPTS